MPSPGDENISNSEFRPQHLNCVVKLGLLHRLCVLNWELVRHFLISPLTFSLEYIRLWSWHQHPPMARVVPGSSHGMKNEWFSMNIFWYGWMTPWARNMQKWREFCRWNVPWGWFRSVTSNSARPSPQPMVTVQMFAFIDHIKHHKTENIISFDLGSLRWWAMARSPELEDGHDPHPTWLAAAVQRSIQYPTVLCFTTSNYKPLRHNVTTLFYATIFCASSTKYSIFCLCFALEYIFENIIDAQRLPVK